MDKRHRSTVARRACSRHAVSSATCSKCGQRLVDSRRGRLNTDLLHLVQQQQQNRAECQFTEAFLPARRYASADTSYGRVSISVLSVCLSVCVCHKSEFYRNRWTNRAGFGTGAYFHLAYTVFKGNSGIFKNKGTSLWNFVPNSGLIKFRHGISIVKTCY